jgi:hypothetical protein
MEEYITQIETACGRHAFSALCSAASSWRDKSVSATMAFLHNPTTENGAAMDWADSGVEALEARIQQLLDARRA